jgi:general nucleoside transport system permease protein
VNLRAFAQTGLFTALAVFTALVLGAVVIIATADDPSVGAAWDAYKALFDSALGGEAALERTLVEATPLLFAGLSVALAFRAGLFNIGGAGQLIAGACAAGYVGFTFDLPAAVHLPLAVLAGAAGGMVWGGIAGFLKAKTGAHEVISTIMLNFVALRLLDWFLSTTNFQRGGRNDPISKVVRESARLPELPGPFGHLGLVLALAATVGVWWLLTRSTVGFRMRAVGANPHAARTAGMAVGATYLLSMALAGALAGLAGTANLLGRPSFSLIPGFYRQIGFDAIALALLGRSKPSGVVGAALLFGALRAGSTGMQAATSTPVDIIVVIQALIIAFVAAPKVVEAIWRIRARGVEGQTFTTGWGAA